MTEPQRNMEAERIYAAAWASWLQTTNQETKCALERTMDAQQPRIANSPTDPRWQTFADSLPGYRDYWSRTHRRVMKKLKVRFSLADILKRQGE